MALAIEMASSSRHVSFTATADTRLKPPPAQTIDLAKLTVDTDGDGWTDVEERRLGLNSRNRDTDNDGIPDDRDPMPLFATPAARPDEDERILQRAIFASFGLTGAPHALFVGPGSRRLHMDSSAGPMLYGQPTNAQEGILVGWRLVDKEGDSATVAIMDYEGPLSASTHFVSL
jgi:hypothetical protein